MKLKSTLALFLAIVLTFALVACSAPKAPADTSGQQSQNAPDGAPLVRVAALSGSTGLGMAKLMTDAKAGKTTNSYTFEVFDAPEQLLPEITSGKFDIAALPTNVAAKLYNTGSAEIQMLALNTLGVLYVMEIGTKTVESVADLRGKTIYTTGQGATPEYALRYVLEKNGLDPDKDVTIVYETTADLVVSHAESGAILMLPEPKVTAVKIQLKDKAPSVVLNLTEEWDKVCDTPMVQGCVVVSKSFAKANPDAVSKFLAEYEASINFVKTNVAEASEMVATHGIIPKAPIAAQAIPNSNLTFKAGKEMKEILVPFYEVLSAANAKSIGGKLPADDFYYGA